MHARSGSGHFVPPVTLEGATVHKCKAIPQKLHFYGYVVSVHHVDQHGLISRMGVDGEFVYSEIRLD